MPTSEIVVHCIDVTKYKNLNYVSVLIEVLTIIIGIVLFTNNRFLLIRSINRSMLTLPLMSIAIIQQHATTIYFA